MISVNTRSLRSLDKLYVAVIILLSSIGLLFVFSTTYQDTCPYSLFFKKQTFGLITGYAIFIGMSCMDYRRMQRWGYIGYILTLLLLLFTLFKGSMGLGAQRWINLGLIKFQPSELAKLFFPAFFTSLVEIPEGKYVPNNFGTILLLIAVSFLLVARQPDLGTAIIIGSSALLLLYYEGVHKFFFICLFGTILVSTPILWKLLKPYQKQRIFVFLGYGDTKKERYQIEQSRIAIGSGGITGKGLLRGTQNIMQFLPESRTDFIFSIVCEEWGFIGALLIILLYAVLFLRALLVIPSFSNHTTQVLAIGLIAPSIIATIINMCMVTELLPSVGIPLPLMSYGITHSWITFASLGWFNSIALQSK